MVRDSALHFPQDTSNADIDCKMTMANDIGAISEHGNIKLLGNAQYQSISKIHNTEEKPNYACSNFALDGRDNSEESVALTELPHQERLEYPYANTNPVHYFEMPSQLSNHTIIENYLPKMNDNSTRKEYDTTSYNASHEKIQHSPQRRFHCRYNSPIFEQHNAESRDRNLFTPEEIKVHNGYNGPQMHIRSNKKSRETTFQIDPG